MPTGHLTTHALDTHSGCPAAGLGVTLWRLDTSEAMSRIGSWTLNHDGRAPAPLLAGATMAPGRYRLVYAVAAYFTGRGVVLPDPPFLADVPIDFGIADAALHYHVPLLVSPWAYSTYRGS